ncbi:MAG: caspase family protein [Saprospiraceae bacterium]|nr:caspase family protein [Saprospiraceae bacterium]
MSNILLKVRLFAAIFLFAASSSAQDKVALLMAVGDYPDTSTFHRAPLVCVKDALRLKPALESQGYKVYMLTNDQVTRGQIWALIDSLAIQSQTTFLIHIGSHGQVFDGKDQFVPFDGSPYGDDPKNISIAEVFQKLCDKGAKTTILFTDCCRTPSRGDPGKIIDVKVTVAPKKSAHILKACNVNEKAYEVGGYGVLTRHLIDLLNDPRQQKLADLNTTGNLSVLEVFRFMINRVEERPGIQQKPQVEKIQGHQDAILFNCKPLPQTPSIADSTTIVHALENDTMNLKKYDDPLTAKDYNTRVGYESSKLYARGRSDLGEILDNPIVSFGAIFVDDDSMLISRKMFYYLFRNPSHELAQTLQSFQLVHYDVRTHPTYLEQIVLENIAIEQSGFGRSFQRWRQMLFQGKVVAPALILVAKTMNGQIKLIEFIPGYHHPDVLNGLIESAMNRYLNPPPPVTGK